jgi:ribA/ribD-fused uncharacterized protein
MTMRFIGPNRFLSNFYPCEVWGPGELLYPSVEHAYQASKSLDEADWRWALRTQEPGNVKRIGRRLNMRPDWTSVRLGIMLDLVRKKFKPGTELADKLVKTHPTKLEEGNNWHDTFWGIDLVTGEGFNHLGRVLMQVRDELIAGAIWDYA